MAEEKKATPAGSSNRSQMPAPPQIPVVNVAVKPDGTPDGEIDGHMDRSQVQEEAKGSMASKLASGAKAALGMGAEDDGVRILSPSEGISVMALRTGYFRGLRLVEGDIFTIPDMETLGDWMALTDPKAEEARRAKEKAEAKQAALTKKNAGK